MGVYSNNDYAIKTVVNEFGWPPSVIDNLYCDNKDYHGLFYWCETLEKLHEKLKTETPNN